MPVTARPENAGGHLGVACHGLLLWRSRARQTEIAFAQDSYLGRLQAVYFSAMFS